MHVSIHTCISTYFSITTLIFINKRSRRRELERSQLNISNLGFLASVPLFSSSCSSRAAARSLHFNLMEHQSKSEQEETNTLASPRSKDEPVTSSSSSKGSAKKPVRIVIKPPSANNEQIKQFVKIEEEDSDSTDDYFLSAEELVEDPVSSESTESDGNGKLYADNVGDIESPYKRICNLCGKSFQSDEALYGRTRLHSHKLSVKKQVKDEALPPSSISYQNLKWKITGKRGRGKKDASDSQSEDVTEVENTHEDSTILKSEQDEDKLQTGIELTIQLKNVSDSEVKSLLGHIDEVVGITSAKAKVSTTLIGSSNATISNEEPKAKRIKLEHSKNDGNSGHVCHICGKAFATHQALGGHAASHNKGKHKLDEGGDQTSKKSKKNTGDSEHRCNKCGAVFQTGQSLGGHMRAHYDPGKDKKSDDKDIVESSTANTMQETGQLPIVKEDNGKVINESTSTNTTMEETGASLPIVNEDIGRVPSESEQNSLQPASAAAPAFDLNEMPGY